MSARSEGGDIFQLFFLTRSTTARSLSHGEFDSSSQAYEVGLLNSLSRIKNMRVHCMGLSVAGKGEGRVALNERLTFESVGALGLFSVISLVYRVIALRRGARVAVLTTGYYPFEMLAMLLMSAFGVVPYSIVFDTHLTSTSGMGVFKRFIANAYYGVGFWILKRLRGVIVLNDGFLRASEFRSRVFRTKIGGLYRGKSRVYAEQDDRRPVKVLFAGTLNADNGVEVVLEGLRSDPSAHVEVVFYGDGEATSRVVEAAGRDIRICYKGRISDAELDAALAVADYLLCLRDPDSLASLYSFPSKLIKFMGSGTPVIANRFPGLDDGYAERVLLLGGFTGDDFSRLLSRLAKERDGAEFGVRARMFVEVHNNWDDIAMQLGCFVFDCGSADSCFQL